VNITCQPSSPALICTVTPYTFSLPGDGSQVPVTISINTQTQLTGSSGTSSLRHIGGWLAGGGITFAMLFFGFPARRRTWSTLFMLVLLVGIGFGAVGCGSSTKITPATFSNAPAGNYTAAIVAVVPSGSSSVPSVTHTMTLKVVVQ
jgi:hypothetical protein